MKYCERVFRHLYIIPNGNVFLCSWNTKPIGNILKQDLKQIWNSDEAEEIRDSIRDGSFRYCKKTGCPFCENNTLKEVGGEESGQELFIPLDYPDEFNCAIDFTCNHSCPSCRNEIFVPNSQYQKNLNIIVDKLLPYLSKARFISTDGQGDCFASPFIMRFMENLHPENPDFHMTIETNGVLFDEKHWRRISHLSQFPVRVVVTPNSFERATYKYLSGGHDDLDKLLQNLKFIRGLRERNEVSDFAISIVVQDRNFRELPAFTQRCLEEFHVDSVSVKPIYKWFKLTEREYMSKDILNPLHPYFDEYQDVLKDPRLQNPKIFWWGAKNIHPKKVMYEQKICELYDITAKWLELLLENPNGVKAYLETNKYDKVGIYGYGRMGKLLKKNLGKFNYVIIDRRPICMNDNTLMILADSDQYPSVDLIIVTPFYEYEEIYKNIREKTKADIISIEQLIKSIAIG